MTADFFNSWLLNLDLEQSKYQQKIALIIDNAPCHKIFSDTKLNFIDVFFLPPNTTSVLQPLDQGIIRSFKSNYKKYFLRNVINKITNEQSIKLNILEVINLIDFSWGKVTEETITNCFEHGFSSKQSIVSDIESSDIEIKQLQIFFNIDENFEEIINVKDNFLFEKPELDTIIENYKYQNTSDKNEIIDPLQLNFTIPDIASIRNSLVQIRNFFISCENVSYDNFSELRKVEDFVENQILKNKKQQSLF